MEYHEILFNVTSYKLTRISLVEDGTWKKFGFDNRFVDRFWTVLNDSEQNYPWNQKCDKYWELSEKKL